jgi:peptide alpha-N-acetyltransferase
MVDIRPSTVADIIHIQACNLQCLPENYSTRYFFYHYFTSPYTIYVGEQKDIKKICGYVLSKLFVYYY